MSDDNAFTGENPFAKLDKTLFRATETEQARQRAVDLKHAKHLLGMENTAKTADEKNVQNVGFAPRSPDDENDAALFLGAVSAARPLNKDAKLFERAFEPNPFAAETPSERQKTGRRKKHTAVTNAGFLTPVPVESAATQNASSKTAATHSFKGALPTQNDAPQEEDAPAFMNAMRDVAPLSGKGREVPADVPVPVPTVLEDPNPLQEFMEGKPEFSLASTDEYVEGHVIGLDLMLVGKLQAGQLSPEGHLDLHGLNAQQAFQALVGFIRSAYLKDQRVVLVVPGRGKNSPYGMSILREKVQSWFTQEPFRRVILAFCTARPTDGGAGAMYVLLRKLRKNRGKVYWDRRPVDPDLLD